MWFNKSSTTPIPEHAFNGSTAAVRHAKPISHSNEKLIFLSLSTLNGSKFTNTIGTVHIYSNIIQKIKSSFYTYK